MDCWRVGGGGSEGWTWRGGGIFLREALEWRKGEYMVALNIDTEPNRYQAILIPIPHR